MTPLPLFPRILATWLGILPVALAAQALLAPLAASWPGPWTTVAALTLAVPVGVVWTVPWALRLVARLVRPASGVRRSPAGSRGGAATAPRRGRSGATA